jgi:hypothetical protein
MTNIRSLVDNIVASNNVSAQEKIADIMAEKLQTLLDLAKIEVAQGMFNTCEDCSQETITQEQYDGLTEEEQADFELIDEALQGNQHKIDANKNGKVDAHDFKMLRKKKGVKEDVEQVDEDTFEQGGKTKMDFKTPRHVSPHFKYLKKLSPAEEKADMLKRAGLKDVSKKPPAVKKEEVEQIDEISQKTKDSYVAKRGSQLSSMMYGPSKNQNLLSGKKQAKAVKGIKQALKKEEVESTSEAYSDPYAAKKSAEMKKAHAATMADAKKEYDAARKPKFAKNFMKMKKEDVNLQELDADTLRSYLGKQSAPPKVAPQDMFRRKQYTPDELRVAKKRQKGKDNAFASLVKKTASPARDAYDNAAAASYNKAKPGTYHGD